MMNYPFWIGLTNIFATLFLLVAGAWVTTTNSGLSVPDWPLSYGTLFPEMKGGVFYEHGHRLIAGGVLILTVIQTYVFLRFDNRTWVRRLTLVALIAVLCQAGLGGLTVLLRLPPQVSVAHACLAQLFFCAIVIMTYASSKGWSQWKPNLVDTLPSWVSPASLMLSAMFFCQLVVGAWMRHTGAGLAIPDFPLAFGRVVPAAFDEAILTHYIHRMGGFTIAAMAALIAAAVLKRLPNSLDAIRWAGALITLVSIQILLGASVVLMKRPPDITSVHLAVGALCFACSIILSVRLSREKFRSASWNVGASGTLVAT